MLYGETALGPGGAALIRLLPLLEQNDLVEAQPIPQADRRGAQRHKAFLACRIVYGETAISIEGVVRNLSATGAMVRTPSAMALPGRVTLMLVKGGEVFEAKVIWRRDCDIGLELGVALALDDLADEAVQALRRLRLSLAGSGETPL